MSRDYFLVSRRRAMSYDISLCADLGGPRWAEIAGTELNYTGNCAPMWRAAGADLAEFHGKRADDCHLVLLSAIFEMDTHPEKYAAMNPANGWGNSIGCRNFLQDLADVFAMHPNAIVSVCR